jgi:hypothetical protein
MACMAEPFKPLWSVCHRAPSQWAVVPTFSVPPTTHTSLGPEPQMACISSPALASTFHAVPFHRRIEPWFPAAQIELGSRPQTAMSDSVVPEGTTLIALPSK